MIGNISKSKAQKGDPLTFDMLTEAEKASLSPKPDWNQTDETKADFIKNKPTIPVVDDEVSVFSNNAVSNAAVTEYIENRHRALIFGEEIVEKAWSDGKGNEIHTTYATKEELANVGGGITVDTIPDEFSNNPISNSAITSYVIQAYRDITEGNDNTIVAKSACDAKGNVIHETYAPMKKLNDLYLSAELSSNRTDVMDKSTINDLHYPTTIAVANYVESKIGDIETSLENIIAKYGLGGDSV